MRDHVLLFCFLKKMSMPNYFIISRISDCERSRCLILNFFFLIVEPDSFVFFKNWNYTVLSTYMYISELTYYKAKIKVIQVFYFILANA